MSFRVNRFLPLTTILPLLLCCCEENSGNNLRSATPVAGENSADGQPTVTATYEMPVPLVQELAPTYVAAGDVLTAYGKGFVPKRYGTTLIRLQGEFTSLSGHKTAIDYLTESEYVNSGKVTFTFEPAEEGSFGREMGSFRGYVSATNRGNDGKLVAQQEEPAQFNVATKPSIVVSSVFPMKESCENKLLKKSVEGTTIGMDVNLIGFTPTEMNPVTVTIMYMDLATAAASPCPLSVLGISDCSFADDDGLHIQEKVITDPEQLSFSLRNIDFGPITTDVLNTDAMVSINVSDGIETVSRIITVTMYKSPYVVEYDGNYQIAEVYEPEPVSYCIYGGDYGSSVSYNENNSESRSRSCGLNLSAGLKIPGLDKILSLGFGMNVSESVSSSHSAGLGISRQIIAHQYAVVYRQTQRILRSADIVEYGACGNRQIVGEALLTDWTWAPDIAVTKDGQCPPLPPSNLSHAKCYINCD